MKTSIKTMSILIFSLVSLLFISSCGDDDKEKQKEQEIIENSNIKGIVFTEKTIKVGNTLRAIVGTDSGEGEVVGTSTVEDKKFSLSLNTPTLLSDNLFEEVPEGVTVSNPDAKTAVFSTLELLKGGTVPMDEEDILMCSDQAPKLNTETSEITFTSMIVHVYANANVTIKGEYVEAIMDNEENTNLKVNVSLKKGWNIVAYKIDKENAEIMSLSEISANYKWYLLSDVLPYTPYQSSHTFKKTILNFPWMK